MSGKRHSLTYIGAGGNIGSQAVVALARSGLLARMTLVDPDVYEPRNLRCQDIDARDLGQSKVHALAARLCRIDADLRVETIAKPVERVPLGHLRADLIATGLDGLASRCAVNRAARRLGIPWVDAGVRAEGLLVRVDVFAPTPQAACFECSLTAAERADLDNRYPCDPPPSPAPTAAPAYLGALAAGVQCAECVKLLRGADDDALTGCQLLTEVSTYKCYVSERRCSPECAFDHRRWSIRALAATPGAISLGRALRLAPTPRGVDARLRVEGDHFVHRLVCPDCHESRDLLRLAGRIDPHERACPRCGAAMLAPGVDTSDTLGADRLTGRSRRASLYSLGLRSGDVFSIETASGEAHYEIGGG